MKMRTLTAVVFLGAALARAHVRTDGASLRATRHKAARQPDGTFDKLDADDDGSISWDEFRAAKDAGQRLSQDSLPADRAEAEEEGPEDDPDAAQPSSRLAEQLRDAAAPQSQEPQDTTQLSADERDEAAESEELEASDESMHREDSSSEEDSHELMSEELEPNTQLGDDLRTVMPNMPLRDEDALKPYQGDLPPEEEEEEASAERDDVDAEETNAPEPEEEDVDEASGKEPATKAVEVDDWLPASERGTGDEDVEDQATEQTRWESEEQGAEAVVREEHQQEHAEHMQAVRKQEQQFRAEHTEAVRQQKQLQQSSMDQALSGCKWCAQTDPNCDQLWCSNNCAKQCAATKAGAMLGPAANEAQVEPQWSGDSEPQLSGCAWCSANDAACQQPWCSQNCPQQCVGSQQGLHRAGSAGQVEDAPQLSGCQWCLANDVECGTKWCANNCGAQCQDPRKQKPATAAAREGLRAQAAGGLSPGAPREVPPATPTNNAAVPGPLPWMSSPPATPAALLVQGPLRPMSFLEAPEPSLARQLQVLPPTPSATD